MSLLDAAPASSTRAKQTQYESLISSPTVSTVVPVHLYEVDFEFNIPEVMARRWQRSWPLPPELLQTAGLKNTHVYTSPTESSIFAHGGCDDNDKLASQSWLLLESQLSV